MEDLLGGGDLEEVGTGNAASDLRCALFSEQVADLIEELVQRAVNVEGGSQGRNVLGLHHNLSPDGWNIEFLEQVCARVKSDNDVL